MADTIPLQWKNKSHTREFVSMDSLTVLDIQDNVPNNKWQLKVLPEAPNTLTVREGDGGVVLWREHDPVTNEILRGGMFPSWMIVSIDWSL